MKSFLRLIALPLAALFLLAGCGNSEPATASFLFVNYAESATVDTAPNGVMTLTLHGVSPKTIYFSDRPTRLSGHVYTSDFVSQWNSPAVQDSFKTDPPNAVIEGTKAGTNTEQAMVVELTNPRLKGTTLTYTATRVDTPSKGLSHYKDKHQANLPHDLTNVSIFIDDAVEPLPTDPAAVQTGHGGTGSLMGATDPAAVQSFRVNSNTDPAAVQSFRVNSNTDPAAVQTGHGGQPQR